MRTLRSASLLLGALCACGGATTPDAGAPDALTPDSPREAALDAPLPDALAPPDAAAADVPAPLDAAATDVPAPPDAPAFCSPPPSAQLVLDVRRSDGTRVDCRRGSPPILLATLADELTLRVLSVSDASGSTELRFDECVDTARCASRPGVLQAQGPGVSLAGRLQAGQFLRLRSTMSWDQLNCSQELALLDLPLWEGVRNPVTPPASLLAAFGSGAGRERLSLGFTLQTPALPCPSPPEPRCATGLHLYAFELSWPCASCPSPPTAQVLMGATGELTLEGARYAFTNVRSYSRGNCDEAVPWDWYLLPR